MNQQHLSRLHMKLDTVIQKAKENDSWAFDTLYRTYYPKMMGVCMKIVKDADAAKDLVHDAFILAFSSICKLRNNERFSEWLTTIVRNVSLKYVEQEDRYQNISVESAGLEDELADLSSDPESEISYKELLGLVSQLPEGYRNIFRMSVIEGLTHNEIAQIQGIEPHSSSSQLSRAKRFLKKLMNDRVWGLLILLAIPASWLLIVRHQGGHNQPAAVAEQTASACIDEFTQAVQTDIVETERDISNVSISYDESIEKRSLTRNTDKQQTKPEKSELYFPNDSAGESSNLVKEDDKLPEENITNDEELSSDTNRNDDEAPCSTNLNNWKNERSGKFHLLASCTIGESLHQDMRSNIAPGNLEPHIHYNSDYVPFPIDLIDNIQNGISDWSDYWNYLYFYEYNYSQTSAKVISLMEIAKHNSGKITEKVKYDQPVTFGLSCAMMLNEKWNMESGLHYSILGTQSETGDNGYSIINREKVHYLGVPLRLSHTFEQRKRLSAYWSAGVMMHIPVYSKSNITCVVNWEDSYYESGSIEPDIQWQAQISLGLQYRFAPKASLFVEPSLNRFLKSDSQVRTVWNEQPFMCTVPFGIRIFR